MVQKLLLRRPSTGADAAPNCGKYLDTLLIYGLYDVYNSIETLRHPQWQLVRSPSPSLPL